MAPDIARQFRGIEDLLQIQERQERISFVGTDISPVIQHDPPSLDLIAPTLEDVLATGPAILATGSTVPAGFFREVMRATINHDEGIPILNIEVRLVRAADSAFINVISTFASLPDPITQNVFAQARALIPPGWFLEAEFPALSAGKIGRLKTLFIDRVLGLTPNQV